MKALIGIKRVVDVYVKVRPRADLKAMDLKNLKMSVNPFCEIAVEQAVQMKEKGLISEITALSIGPKLAQEQLRTALAMGCDKAILVETNQATDFQLQPLQLAKVFKSIIEKNKYDLVILGKQATDSDNNMTGQMIATLLNWPIATFAYKITLQDKKLSIVREIDGGLQTVELTPPAVITCDLRLNTPRYATIPNIMKAKKKPLETLKFEDLVSAKSSVEYVKIEPPRERKSGVKVETADDLLAKLKEMKVL